MKICTQIYSEDELNYFISNGINDLILAPKDLSRRGSLSLQDTKILLEKAYKLKANIYIQADLIISQNNLSDIINKLESLPLNKASAIRIQDIGLAHYISLKNLIKIHLICETGNYNVQAILAYKKQLKNISRFVLSGEVPGFQLKKWIEKNDVEMELLVLGPILLFYSFTLLNLMDW